MHDKTFCILHWMINRKQVKRFNYDDTDEHANRYKED